ILGMLHLWANSPHKVHGIEHAGGGIGYLAAAPLTAGLSAVLAVPVLFLLGAFGALVVTATPLHHLPQQIRELFAKPEPEAPVIANKGRLRSARATREPMITTELPDDLLEDPFPVADAEA